MVVAFLLLLNTNFYVFKHYNILWNNIFHFLFISCIIPIGHTKMAAREIKIRDDEDFITLNVLLKLTGLIDTGGQAKIYLRSNVIYVNGEEENRRGRKLYRGDTIKAGKAEFVIR